MPPLPVHTSYQYDVMGRVEERIEAAGSVFATQTTTDYDQNGNVVSVTTGQAVSTLVDDYAHESITTYHYDPRNRLDWQIDGDGSNEATKTTFQYDLASRLVSQTTGLSPTWLTPDHLSTTVYEYDLMDRVTREIVAAGSGNERYTDIVYDNVGNVIQVTDPRGTITQWHYDVFHRVVSVTEAVGQPGQQRTTVYEYDAANNRTAERRPGSLDGYDLNPDGTPNPAPSGVWTAYVYDARNRLVQQTDAAGVLDERTSTFVYDLDDHLLQQTTGQGAAGYAHVAETHWGYDALGRPFQLIEAKGTAVERATTYRWDAGDHLVAETRGLAATNAHPVTQHYQVDLLGRQTALIEAPGTSDQRRSEFRYDAAGNRIAQTVHIGDGVGAPDGYDQHVTITSAYDALNRVTLVTEAADAGFEALRRESLTTYDAAGNILTVTTGLSTSPDYAHPSTTTFTYYAGLDLRQTMTEAMGTTTERRTEYVYDPNGNLTELRTGLSADSSYAKPVTTTSDYDRLNRLTEVTEAAATADERTSLRSYDAADNLVQLITGMAPAPYGKPQVTEYGYDNLNRQVRTDEGGTLTLPTDATTVTWSSDARRTVTEYDAADNAIVVALTPRSFGAGPGWTAATDDQYLQTMRTVTSYDALNRPLQVTQAATLPVETTTLLSAASGYSSPPMTSTVYDAADNVIAIINPRGVRTSYTFDHLNRRVLEIAGDQYPADMATGAGWEEPITWYRYDAADNVIEVTQGVGSTAETTTQAGYDPLGRRLEVKEAVGTPEARWSNFAYDAANNLIKQTTGQGAATIYLAPLPAAPSAWGPETSASLPPMNLPYTTAVAGLAYDYAAVQVTAFAYDALNRRVTVSALADWTDAAILLEFGHSRPVTTYRYDAANNLLEQISTGDSTLTGPGERKIVYTYDDLNRQRTTTEGEDARVTKQVYDAAGNVTQQRDATGALTATLYDDLNRPVHVVRGADKPSSEQTVVTYAYNLFGQTVQQTGTGTALTTTTLTIGYDRLGRVILEQSSPDNRVRHEYDAAGNETATHVEVQRTFRAPDGSLQQTDWLVNSTQFGFDPLNRRLSQTFVADFRDGSGLAQDAVSTYAYDVLGRVVSKLDANRVGTPTADDPRLLSADDPQFAPRFWIQPDLVGPGIPVETFLASRSGRRVDYQYNALGQLVLEQWVTTRPGQPDAEVGRLAYVYDAQGQLLESQQFALNVGTGDSADAGGESFTAYPNAAWGVIDWGASYPDPNYGLLGSAHGLIVPDVAWNPGAVQDRGAIHTYQYDGLGRVVLEVTNNGKAARTAAADLGAVDSRAVQSQYDAAGRRVHVDGPRGAFLDTTYDGGSRVQAVSYGMTELSGDSGSYRLEYAYQEVAKALYVFGGTGLVRVDQVAQTQHHLPGAGTPTLVVADTYDGASRLTVRTATWLGTALNQLTYDYDNSGRLTQETRSGKDGPDGWFTPAGPRGLGGQDQRQNRAFKLDAIRDIYYDDGGQISAITLGETVQHPTTGAAQPAEEDYSLVGQFDANGGPIFPSQAEAEAPGNRDRTRHHDVGTPFTETLVTGKVVFKTNAHAVQAVQEYLYDAEGNLIVSYTHHPDATPDARLLYSYDHRNRLVHVTLQRYLGMSGTDVLFQTQAEVFYRYDAEDHLIHRFEVWHSPPAAQLDLGWQFSAGTRDEYGNALEVVASGGTGRGDVSWSLRELHFVADGSTVFGYYEDGGSFTRLVGGLGIDELAARQSTNTNAATKGTKWYLTDRQGSVVGLVNATSFNPSVPAGDWAKVVTYGGAGVDRRWAPGPAASQITASFHALHDEFEYTGRYTDYVTSLQYNRARWYSPATGQFMAKDSWGYAAGDTNLYRYAHNNFVNAADPSGHIAFTAGLGLAGGLIGGFSAMLSSGQWDAEHFWAGAASGALIGAAIGLTIDTGGTGVIGGAALLGAGLGSAAGGGAFTPGGGVNWDGLLVGGVVGGASGAVGGAVGLGAGMALGAGVWGMVGAGVVSGLAGNATAQGLNLGLGTQADWSWRQFITASLGGALAGGLGSVFTRGLMNPATGKIASQVKPMSWLGRTAAGGFLGGAAGDAIDQGSALWMGEQQRWDWGRTLLSGGLAAANAVAAGYGQWRYHRSCFAAGTPLRTPEGSKSIEQFRPGDVLWSRDEFDPEGLVEAKVVEEVFDRTGRIWQVRVGSQVIKTTAEHPFYVLGEGWLAAAEMAVGDHLLSHEGQWVTVADLLDTGKYETVYNLRVADFHTYFVGDTSWGFSVWTHNQCGHFVDDLAGAGVSEAAVRRQYFRIKNLPAGQQEAAFRSYLQKKAPNMSPAEVDAAVARAMAPELQGTKGGVRANQIGQEGEAVSTRIYGPKNNQTWDVPGYTKGAKPDHVLAVDPATGRPTAVAESKNMPYYYKSTQIEQYLDLVGPNALVIVAVPKSGAKVSQDLIRTPGVEIAYVLPPR